MRGNVMEVLTRSEYKDGPPHHPLVIGYFTVDTPYEHEAEVLKVSLESVGYSYLICGIPNQGSWQKNTQIKAQFILCMLQEHPGKPLLYLDVDAIMVQPPVLLDTICADIAAVHYTRPHGELLSGTLYLGNTIRCNALVRKWISFNEQYPVTLPNGKDAWDQRTLKMAIKRISGLKFVELPQEYTWIVELTSRHCPGLNPIILHTRGAKRFKNIINGEKGYEK